MDSAGVRLERSRGQENNQDSERRRPPLARLAGRRAAPTLGRPTGRRRWLYRLAAGTLVPVILLALLEIGLRLCGYGYPTAFFVWSALVPRRTRLRLKLRFRPAFFPTRHGTGADARRPCRRPSRPARFASSSSANPPPRGFQTRRRAFRASSKSCSGSGTRRAVRGRQYGHDGDQLARDPADRAGVRRATSPTCSSRTSATTRSSARSVPPT